MNLIEVQLRNWRSYRNATFTFPAAASGKRNVILVGAQNGVGKTSLLTALYLGLFGRDAMRLIEGIRISEGEEQTTTYRNLLERTIHRPSLQSDEPIAMVRLKFETKDGTSIVVRRKWGFLKRGKVRDLGTVDGEEVIIEVDQEIKRYDNWQEANDRVTELLFPVNVMACFFFDGEQAQERVEAAKGALLGAVETLYGTGLLAELKRSLNGFISAQRDALRRDVGHVREDELDRKRADLEAVKAESDQVAAQLVAKRKESEQHEALRQRYTNDLMQLVGDNSTDINLWSETIKALQSEQIELRQKLTSGLAGLALPLALSRSAGRVVEQLKGERVRDEWVHLKQAAMGKASAIVEQVLPAGGDDGIEPPLADAQRDGLRRKLETALEELWNPPPDGCADEYKYRFLREADRSALVAKIERLQRSSSQDVAKLALEWNRVTTLLREAQRKFDAVRDVEPKLMELKANLNNVTKAIADVSAELNSLQTKEKHCSNQIKELRGSIGQSERKQSLADPVQQKLSVAHRVTEVLDEASERLVPLCKELLEERCTYHFSRMISDEYQSFSVRFEADAEPRLDNGTQVVFITSLSGAQKRAFGLAFTLAVADVSRQKAPIVIDTPVGNMDSRYRDRVLKHLASSAPGQVIFLSHDEEISAEYKKKLNPHVSKTMLLKFAHVEDGSGSTTIQDNAYFGDRAR